VDIVLERTYPAPFPGATLDRRLFGWSRESDYHLVGQAGGLRVFERGLPGWQGVLATSVLEVPTRVTMRHAGGRLACTLRCASRLRVESPRWLLDDRQPLRQDLDRLGVWLGGDKVELDRLLVAFGLSGGG
jgi:hypothetical protein